MKLRKQLLFVSLVTLTLPWVGCQYIQEMESTLRQGQVAALSATAKAVAARLGSDPLTVAQLDNFTPPAGSTPIYAHRTESSPLLDGYDTEWTEQALSMQALRDNRGELRAQIGASVVSRQLPAMEATLSLFVRVKDNSLDYYKPTQSSPRQSDHVILHLTHHNQPKRLLIFFTGPGDLRTAWLTDNDQQEVDYWAKGLSNPWQNGYQFELQIPLGWTRLGLGVEIFDSIEGNVESMGSNVAAATNLGVSGEIPPLVVYSGELSRQLAVFSRSGVKLQIATTGSRPVAEAGQLQSDSSKALHNRHTLVNWFYRVALGEQKAPRLETSEAGLLDTPEISAALRQSHSDETSATYGWYQQDDQTLARVTVPVFNQMSDLQHPIAAVIADESADSLISLTSSAFYRLLFYSLVASFLASLTLIGYASWLSFRVRKLSRAAANAISESGQIADSFPILSGNDEIGELSRSYNTLLTRLREYTSYLRSLSSKLSHELRTPLAIVKSSLDNLEYEALSDSASTYADRAREGANRLSSILNAMSAASRVEQSISAADVEDIPCDQLLENLCAAYADAYPKVRFTLNIAACNKPFRLTGSGELLVQMFDKLVDNAADFSPEDGEIELGLSRTSERLVFTVRNQGPPLPAHMHNQLFDSMVSVREKSSTASQGHHLGLGLYIVRLITDFHRGSARCYNAADGTGVIFEISLPAA